MTKRSIKDFVKSIYDIVIIGSSSGGIEALNVILSSLKGDFSIPIVIVQHRAELSAGLSEVFQISSDLPVVEPEDKSRILPGHIYVAPSGYHLLIEQEAFALSTDAYVNWSRPSIDVLFESAAENYGSKVIGIVLTGRNNDGAKGLAILKAFGALTIVQDPSSAPNRDMPDSAIAASNVDHVLNLDQIAEMLIEADQTKKRLYESMGSNDINNGTETLNK